MVNFNSTISIIMLKANGQSKLNKSQRLSEEKKQHENIC